MPSYRKAVPRAALLALLCAACSPGSSGEAPAADSASSGAAAAAGPAADSPGSGTTGGGWSEPVDSSGSGAGVTVRYEHTTTCTRFMGREGQFFAYRITSVRNGGAAPFTLEPQRLRLPGSPAGMAPVFSVPEISDLEVPAGATQESEEIFLLERGGAGAPPRGPVPLRYDTPGVEMVRGSAEPAYDTGTGCDGFNT